MIYVLGMLIRSEEIRLIEEYRSIFPVVCLIGPRQCGKTTLARQLAARHRFDLEDPRDFAALQDPMLALEPLSGLVVIDEVQLMPGLFPVLRVLVDRDPNFERRQFLLLGSASPELSSRGSESLAGRVGYVEIGGFRHSDLEPGKMRDLWFRGGLPRAFLAKTDSAASLWHENYIRTFLERDLPLIGLQLPKTSMRQFWEMLGHNHGGVLNLAELGRSFGKSETTVKRYAQLLEDALMVRLLQPWHTNIGKRLVQRPKVYVRDSGVLHRLLGIASGDALLRHIKVGASWEGFALEQVIRRLSPRVRNFHFWATHSGAEVDLLWEQGGRLYGVEFRYGDAPTFTRSMRSAMESLDLERLWVICPVARGYSLADRVSVVGLEEWRDPEE
jgi:uncharacterized protein